MQLSTVDPDAGLKQALLARAVERSRTNFHSFLLTMAPVILPEGFISGRHIEQIADKLQAVGDEEGVRLIVELPPGSMKSKMTSVLLPAWLFGRRPTIQFLQVCHSGELAAKWGREVRDLLETPEYQLIFPHTKVSKVSYAAERWNTTAGGGYLGAGANKPIAGFRGNVINMDDLLSEQSARSDTERKTIIDNLHGGIMSRLLPGGNVIVTNTRWHVMDPAGYFLKQGVEHEDADQWERLTYTALADAKTAKMVGVPEGTSYWPEFWSTEYFEKLRTVMPTRDWAALYMQNPIVEGGNIIRRSWIKSWDEPKPPPIDYCLISVDSAFSTEATADYTAVTIWGIFNKGVEDSLGHVNFVPNMILLGGKRERMEFPDLCAYLRDLNRRRKPDTFLIEKKASGQSIIQELRRQGLPMTAWTPDRDKISRVWATQPIFEAGRIWMNKGLRFSGLVMDDLESFPNGEHDDIVDSVTQAVLWMRRSRIDIFEQAEDRAPKRRVITSYWKLPKKMVY